jgi:hypothetical protein
MPLEIGWWPISIKLEVLTDVPNEQVYCEPQITGGSAPYAIEVSLDGVPLNYSDPLVIPFGSLSGGWQQVCAVDANGCMSCEGAYVTNPFLTCTMDLAVVQQDNFVTVTPVVTMGDVEVEEFEGVLFFDSDSLYQIWVNSSHAHYFNDLGIHEICYQTEEYT